MVIFLMLAVAAVTRADQLPPWVYIEDGVEYVDIGQRNSTLKVVL